VQEQDFPVTGGYGGATMTERQRMRLIRWSSSAVSLVLMAGCASSPTPKEYGGPTATLRDTARVEARATCGDFFFLYEYQGQSVDNAVSESAKHNAGNGFALREAGNYERKIPAQSATFHIAGRTHCAAPIQELAGTVYLIDGDVKFTPMAGDTYVIKGELGPEHSAVWVENEASGRQVGNKLIVNGPAKAGFFKGTGKVIEIPPNPDDPNTPEQK
jgi:hypothetical protein